MRGRLTPTLFAAIVVLAHLPAALANDQAKRGEVLMQNLCAHCHAIGLTGDSPFAEAPPFREVVTRYPVEHLAEALSEGIEVGHPAMPVFEFDTPMVEDLLAYLTTLAEAQ